MAQTPSKEKRKEDKDNIFVDMLYNLVICIPVMIISWVWEKITDS